MSDRDYRGPKLPHDLLAQVGGAGLGKKRGNARYAPGSRRDKRKAERVQKKSLKAQPKPPRRPFVREERRDSSDKEVKPVVKRQPAPEKKPQKQAEPPKSILKGVRPTTKASEEREKSPETVLPRSSRAVKERLARDDDEVAALEKKLGLKTKSKLPQSFEDDGLGGLLEGLSDDLLGDSGGSKRKRGEYEDFLKTKRRKPTSHDDLDVESQEDSDSIVSEDDEEGNLDLEEIGNLAEESDEGTPELTLDSDVSEGEFEGFSSEEEEEEDKERSKPVRENPYIAPGSGAAAPAAKYIPPSLRTASASDTEILSRLRRQTQGLINKLSEANLLTILRDVEQLYQNNARQHVTSTLIDLVMGSVSIEGVLSDTFLILHAGFVAAIYKVIGTDFGAQLTERTITEFDRVYKEQQVSESGSKAPLNLISFLAYLYTFQVVASNILFDYIRILLQNLSESNTDLLLRIVKSCGQQLRSDDPTSLKNIVLLLQNAISNIGADNVSVKTKFTVEIITDLKNNRQRAGVAASSVASEHTIRMKKTLGSLNQRTIKAAEPLRIGLADIRDTEKKGKWWLVGASWQPKETASAIEQIHPSTSNSA
ncbi:hypothetical protein LTS18_004345, partial [Coniosporium uncinatum]